MTWFDFWPGGAPSDWAGPAAGGRKSGLPGGRTVSGHQSSRRQLTQHAPGPEVSPARQRPPSGPEVSQAEVARWQGGARWAGPLLQPRAMDKPICLGAEGRAVSGEQSPALQWRWGRRGNLPTLGVDIPAKAHSAAAWRHRTHGWEQVRPRAPAARCTGGSWDESRWRPWFGALLGWSPAQVPPASQTRRPRRTRCLTYPGPCWADLARRVAHRGGPARSPWEATLRV